MVKEVFIFVGLVILALIALMIASRNFEISERVAIRGKKAAMYPRVNKNLLFTKPQGIVFGRQGRHYVCKPINVDGHIGIIGGSGSAKTSTIIMNTCLVNPDVSKFVVDIKGEINEKTTEADNRKAMIINPGDRSTCGYNPLYRISKNSSKQEVLETMREIAFSLVQISATVKDPFWKNSARNLMIGLLTFFCIEDQDFDFISVVDKAFMKPVKDLVHEIVTESEPDEVYVKYLIQFEDMAAETLGGIVSEVHSHLILFTNDADVRYMISMNRRKANPRKLNQGFSIFLAIKEEKLAEYYDLLQLIINQTLSEMTRRPEGAQKVLFIIDELPRLVSAGPISSLLDAARTLRSKGVTLMLVTQSVEALADAYGDNGVADLLSNMAYITVLSANSIRTQGMICDWAGKYVARKTSWSVEPGVSGNSMSKSITYEEYNILEPSELVDLPNTGESLLFTPYGYCRLTKVPYYKDKIISAKSKAIAEHNNEMRKG